MAFLIRFWHMIILNWQELIIPFTELYLTIINYNKILANVISKMDRFLQILDRF